MSQIFNPTSITEKTNEVIVLRNVKRAITDFSMLSDGESVVVGLSGGADSIMLIHFLKTQLKLRVYACHINHMLRGEESDRDKAFVLKFCSEQGIELYSEDVDVTEYASRNGVSIEEAGREIRYTVFEKARVHFGADKIATAHSLSDNAETLLLNLSRGCGLNGLCSIPAVRGVIIRPLLYLSRQEIEQYCLDHSLCYVIDSTNLESVYTRNKIRLEVIPKLTAVNPQFVHSVSKTISTLTCENEYMSEVTERAYEDALRSDGSLSIDKLCEQHIAIRHRMLYKFLDQNNIPRSSDLITRLNHIVECDKGKISVKSNIFVEVKKHTLQISDNTNILDYFEYPLELGEFVDDVGECYTIKLCDSEETQTLKKIYRKLLYICCDYDKIIGKIFIRQRKSGDKITFLGRGTKSIKKLFIDDKLTAAAKSQTLVFADDEGAFALMGYGEDVRVKADETTKTHLVVLRHCE